MFEEVKVQECRKQTIEGLLTSTGVLFLRSRVVVTRLRDFIELSDPVSQKQTLTRLFLVNGLLPKCPWRDLFESGESALGKGRSQARMQFYVCNPSLPGGRVAREVGLYTPAPVCLGCGLWNGNLSGTHHTLDEEVVL